MQLDTKIEQASRLGELRAAEALSKMAKRKVDVKTNIAKIVNHVEASEYASNIEGHAVICYMDILTGFYGITLLTMRRQEALDLVDMLNNRPLGTTVALQEIDRSTIRETLNILSNAYVNELARLSDEIVLMSVPVMVTKDGLEKVIAGVDLDSANEAALFQSQLNIAGEAYQVELFFFFFTNKKDEVERN